MNARRLVLLGIGGMIGMLIYWQAFPPREPIDSANGVYANECCDGISLRDGAMQFGQTTVSYVVELDKRGRYVLPSKYVGVFDGRSLSADSTRTPLKLRLDDAAMTRTMAIPNNGGGLSFYEFVQQGHD